MPYCPNCGWPVGATAAYCPKCWTKVQPETSKPSAQRYVGSNVGQYILPLLENASSSLMIVSPYISAKYASLLVNLAQKGVSVQVITSNEPNPKHQEALSVLRKATGQDHRRYSGTNIVLFVFAILGVIIGLAFSAIAILIAGALLGVLAVFLRKRNAPIGYTTPLQLKVTPQFIHAKMYIVDNKTLVTGSANLTVSGMRHNVEQVEITDDPNLVAEGMKSFKSFWQSA